MKTAKVTWWLKNFMRRNMRKGLDMLVLIRLKRIANKITCTDLNQVVDIFITMLLIIRRQSEEVRRDPLIKTQKKGRNHL